jgi:hypothetical protein
MYSTITAEGTEYEYSFELLFPDEYIVRRSRFIGPLAVCGALTSGHYDCTCD